MSRSEDVKTPLAIIAFSRSIFKPMERDNGRQQYGCTLLFPKSVDLSPLQNAALNAATTEWGEKAKEMIKNGVIKNPFLDGDGKQGRSKTTGEPHAGFPGNTFIRCVSGSDFKPRVFDKRRNPVMDPDECPSGSQVYGVVHAFTWENKENGKGISFGISLLQVVRKAEGDEVLGGAGGPNPDAFFETIVDDEDKSGDVTWGGDGAASLFG